MKFFKILFFFSLILGITLSSCTKDPIDDTEIIYENPVDTEETTTNNLLTNIRSSGNGGMELDCITILYTFELVLEDDTQVSIASEEDFWNLFTDSLNVPVDFVYPLEVLNADDEEIVVDDLLELGELFATCVPDTGWVAGDDMVPAFVLDEDCFQMVFPVDLQNLDGDIIMAENMEEFIDLLSTNEVLFYSWPLDLVDEEGVVYTVESAIGFYELIYSCDFYTNPSDSTWYGEDSTYYGIQGIACYQFVFPFSVVNENDEIVQLEDADALMAFIFNGHFFVDFVYPLDLMDPQGNIVTASDAQNLQELVDQCWGGPDNNGTDFAVILWSSTPGGAGADACYTVDYPITANLIDSSTVQINSDDELFQVIAGGDLYNISVPLTVSLLEDGSVIEINDGFDLFDLIEDCSDVPEWIDLNLFIFSTAAVADSACFEIQYPVEMGFADGTTLEITSDEAFISFMETGQYFQLFYPITVNLLEDGSEIILNEPEDLLILIENCQQ